MARVEANAEWSLFCPNEAPGLADVWGEEFETLYVKYERAGRAKKVIKAQQLWFAILEAQVLPCLHPTPQMTRSPGHGQCICRKQLQWKFHGLQLFLRLWCRCKNSGAVGVQEQLLPFLPYGHSLQTLSCRAE